jgi:hypothetical protein
MNKTISSENVLEAICMLNGIDDLCAVKKDFYYDETNNYRKLRLRDGKLNIEGDGDFMLGGIVVNDGVRIELDGIYKQIRLDKSANEMKFKHVASGNFETILNSKKLKTILDFILQNEIYIHLQRINVLYWSVIDIVESVMVEHSEEYITINHLYLKDLLYQTLIQKKAETLTLLSDFSYPDVESAKLSLFYAKLIGLVKPQLTKDNDLHRLLISVLELGSHLEEAVFIQNEERGLLLGDFSHFYRYRALMFPNSYHYFDAEMQVEENLRATGNSFNGIILDNYSFIDSKQNPAIQLADVTVGYFARLYNFCKGRSPAEFRSIRNSLNKNQLELLKLSRSIIDKSDAQNQAYFHHIIPISDGATWAELVF